MAEQIGISLLHSGDIPYSLVEGREYAVTHGYTFKRQILPGHFLFSEKEGRVGKRSVGEEIQYYEKILVKPRYTRSLYRRQGHLRGEREQSSVEFNDPLFGEQVFYPTILLINNLGLYSYYSIN